MSRAFLRLGLEIGWLVDREGIEPTRVTKNIRFTV